MYGNEGPVLFDDGMVVIRYQSANGTATGTGFNLNAPVETTSSIDYWQQQSVVIDAAVKRFRRGQDLDRDLDESTWHFKVGGLGHVAPALRFYSSAPERRRPPTRAMRLATQRRPVHVRRERLPVRSRPGRRRRATTRR